MFEIPPYTTPNTGFSLYAVYILLQVISNLTINLVKICLAVLIYLLIESQKLNSVWEC